MSKHTRTRLLPPDGRITFLRPTVLGLGLWIGLFGMPLGTWAQAPTVEAADAHWMHGADQWPALSGDVLPPLLEYFDQVVLGQGTLPNSVDLPHLIAQTAASDAIHRWIFLSLDDGRSRATVLRATAPNLATAVRHLAQEVHALRESGASFEGYKLDVSVRLIPRLGYLNGIRLKKERGLYALGLAEDTPTARFTFLPGELIVHNLVDSSQRPRLDNLPKMRPWTSTEAQVLSALADRTRVDLFRLELLSVYSDGREHWPLYRGHRRFDDASLTPQALLESAQGGADYLLRSLDDSGYFVYTYFPKTQETSLEYNILRHAGTTYSLLEVYEASGDPKYLEGGERALAYLKAQIEDCGFEPSMACLVEEGDVKLGGNALALLALAKYVEVTGKTDDLPLMQRLGEYMLWEQTPNGEFPVHQRAQSNGEASPILSPYSPGEAALAFVRHPEGDERWLEAAVRAARWLILERDGGLDIDQLEHDHWLLYALGDLQPRRPDEPLLLEHTRKLVQAVVQGQNRTPAYEDWYGSFYIPPRSTPTAARSEGLMATYATLQRNGLDGLAEASLDTLKAAVRFQLGTQFDDVGSLYLEDRPRVQGAFRGALEIYDIRIDYVQHNISAILGLRRILLAEAEAEHAAKRGD